MSYALIEIEEGGGPFEQTPRVCKSRDLEKTLQLGFASTKSDTKPHFVPFKVDRKVIFIVHSSVSYSSVICC